MIWQQLVHYSYEFGGPLGTGTMMVFFPLLLYYLWICLVFFDGKLQAPSNLAEVGPWVSQFASIAREVRETITYSSPVRELTFPTIQKHAAPNAKGCQIYLGLMAFQLLLAIVLPGYQQEGLPIQSLNGRRLMYNCNALGALYITTITVGILHVTNLFKLSALIDHFGPVMSVAIIVSFAFSTICYFGATFFGLGQPIRMSGNVVYDYFSLSCILINKTAAL